MNPRLLKLATVAAVLTLSLLFATSVLAQTPTVITVNATNIGLNSATLNGNLTDLGSATTVNVLFVYGLTADYGSTTNTTTMTSPGVFIANLTGLSPGTLYHFRAIETNNNTSGYDKTFTTATTPPMVTTGNTTNRTINSVVVNGNLTSLGTATTVYVSFEYGLTAGYGSNTTVQSMTGTGAFSATLTGLSPGTLYHFRAKADAGAHGTNNSSDSIFTTLTPKPPEVTTFPATGITSSAATLSGNLTDLGTSDTVNVFFEYGTDTGYGGKTQAQLMTATGIFSANLTGLSSNTTYHFLAKADGGAPHGAKTGANMTFTTWIPPTVATGDVIFVTRNSALVSANLTSLGSATTVNVFFEYTYWDGVSPWDWSTTSTSTPKSMTTKGGFSGNLTGLSPGTSYIFRAKADGGVHGSGTSAGVSFNTLSLASPQVSTSEPTSITSSTVTLNGNLTNLGTATIVNVSFEYGTTTSYGSETPAQAMISTGAFSANLTGLTPGTTYYLRAKANGGDYGTAYGDKWGFTTIPIPPQVTTSPATDVTTSNATLNGNLTSLGAATTVYVSFEYGLTTSYGSSTTPQSMTSTGNFSMNFTGLNPRIVYHFRAKVDGGIQGPSNGADMTFTTLDPLPPVVNTSAAINVTNSAATLIGNLTDLGTASTANVSFEYGLTTSYGSNTTLQSMLSTGLFIVNLTGLSSNTTYHFRANADSGAHGKGAGPDIFFTTRTPPMVTTGNAANINFTSATVSGNLTSLGTATTTNVSFEYRTETSLVWSTTTARVMTATGAFSANLTGLTPGTTYRFRAKADGGIHGISQGTDTLFTTLASRPLVHTSPTTGVVSNAATLNGYLGYLGLATTINISFEYGPTPSYGSETPAQAMSATGVYSYNLSSLSSNTTYHFRAKAVGAYGTATGTDMFFTTLIPQLQVNTSPATGVTSNTTTLNGNLTDLGTATTANVSFEYGTTTSYGTNTTAQIMAAVGVFSTTLTGLSSNTTYHFRAKADGGVHGTANGTDMPFTTLISQLLVNTSPATAVTSNTATLNGNLTDLGTASTANVSFEYGLTPGYGSSTAAQTMTGTGTFSANIFGLSSNTTYHFRAIANAEVYGIAVGVDMLFITTTVPVPPPPPPPGGGGISGGVSGGSLTQSGFIGTQPFVNLNGYVTSAGHLVTPGGKLTLNIAVGTLLRNIAGTRFDQFTVVTPSPEPPAPASNAIVMAYDLGPRAATFDPFISLTFSYAGESLPPDVAESSLYVAWWNGDSWQTLTSTVDTVTKTVTANVSHFTEFALIGVLTPPPTVVPPVRPPVMPPVVPPAPAAFTTSGLTISPTTVAIGEKVTISVLVANTGELSGNYTLALNINNTAIETKDVTVDGGATQTVTFTASRDAAGTYTVTIDSLSGTFTVTAPPPVVPEKPTPTPTPTPVNNWGLIIGIIAAALAVIGLVLFREKIRTTITKDKRIVHIYVVRPLGPGKHALVVEFATRTRLTKGLHVGIDIDQNFTNFRTWLDNPNSPTVVVLDTGIVKKFAARYKPEMHHQKLRDVNLTSSVSYYWYFETEEPFSVEEVLFLDYNDRKP